MPVIVKKPSTALDLEISGSIGRFRVASTKTGEENNAIEVQYLLSHVELNTSGGMQNRLLKALKPVREVFPLDKLELDELMQRDLNDSRVSKDLIPYLLDSQRRGLVKLFPPIIVVIMPTDDKKHPAAHYAKINGKVIEDSEGLHWHTLTSGTLGQEVFQFVQYQHEDGRLDPHNNASLKLNQNRTRLVIVDGQHRAMALLALFRNKTEWPPDAKPKYEPYYRQWDAGTLSSYDFSDLQLPIMFCTFPALHEGANPEIKIKDACRSVFLALNKNARTVSDSRNKILDDRNLIATFMRDTLTRIKNSSNRRIRIYHARLEHKDRSKLPGAASITSVKWLYEAIEHLLLSRNATGGTTGLDQARENLYLVKDLTEAHKLLNVANKLGSQVALDTTRDRFTEQNAERITSLYHKKYGSTIIDLLDCFTPYASLMMAANDRFQKLTNEEDGRWYQDLIFGQQGSAAAFQEHLKWFANKNDRDGDLVESLRIVYEDFTDKDKRRKIEESKIRQLRNQKYLAKLPLAVQGDPVINQVTTTLFDSIYVTAAFQWAYLFTYFRALEGLGIVSDQDVLPEELTGVLTSYKTAMEQTFSITKLSDLRRLVRVFHGRLSGSKPDSFEYAASSKCLKLLVAPGEMKPDSWIRIRYLLLEAWRNSLQKKPDSSLDGLGVYLDAEVQKCRQNAVAKHFKRVLASTAKDQGMLEENLSHDTVRRIYNTCRQELITELKQFVDNVDEDSFPHADTAPKPPETVIHLSSEEDGGD